MQNCALLARRHIEPFAIDLPLLQLVLNALVEIGEQLLVAGKMFQGADGCGGVFFRSCPRRGSFSKIRRPLLRFFSLGLLFVNAALKGLVLLCQAVANILCLAPRRFEASALVSQPHPCTRLARKIIGAEIDRRRS